MYSPGAMVPIIPPKDVTMYMAKEESPQVLERSDGIIRFLQAVVANPDLWGCPFLENFLLQIDSK